MQPTLAERRGRFAARLTAGASTWAFGLIVAAVLLPVYGQSTASPSGPTLTTATLLEVNGPGVLIPVAIPALACAIVALALRHKCTRGGRHSGTVAWTATGLLAAFALLAILSIGVFVVPVVLLLAAAARLTPSARSAGQRPRPGRDAPADGVTPRSSEPARDRGRRSSTYRRSGPA